MMRRPGLEFEWYVNALAREVQRVSAGREALGDEELAFGWAISNVARILDNIFVDGPIDDKPTKALFSIAHSTYCLLWSAWIDALTGRLASGVDHQRSIHESTDFMRAIHAVPELGFAFFDGRLKTESVRRHLLSQWKQEDNHAVAIARDADRRTVDKIMEPNSHVTWTSMIVTVPLVDSEGDGSLTYIREGANPSLIRSLCQWFAAEALVLYGICKEVFGDRPAIAALHDDETDAIDARLTDQLSSVIDSME
jgi:hypothetical protein